MRFPDVVLFLCLFRDQTLFREDDPNVVKVIYSQLISTLAEKCKLRQRVAATAIVYFRRFFAKNALRDHDPRLIAPVALVSRTAVVPNAFPCFLLMVSPQLSSFE